MTIGFIVTATGALSGKSGSGSPGRARTADLVIKSRRNSHLWRFHDKESQDFFRRHLGLILSTELIPSLSGSVGALLGASLLEFPNEFIGLSLSGVRTSTELPPESASVGRRGQPGAESPGGRNAREWGTLGGRGDARVLTAVVPD